MKRLSDKATYANVVSTICLFLLLGGGAAYAASHIKLGKNSVGAKQLKSNAVTTAKVKNGAITTAKIADGAVNGAKVLDRSLSAADIDQATLTSVRAANVTAIQISGNGQCTPLSPPPSGVTSEHTSKGVCKLTFPSSVANCSTTATPHFRLNSNELLIAKERSIQITSGNDTPNVIAVGTYEELTGKTDYPFDLVMVC